MTNDMTKGSPIKLILSFMVPLLIGNIFQQFYNMADTIIVGRTISVEALAAGWCDRFNLIFDCGICARCDERVLRL